MKHSEIKKDMLVCHITNPKIKMIIIKLANECEDAPSAWCEWLSKDGVYQIQNFMPKHLKKYKNKLWNI
jgi:hypothetical protein